MSTTKLGLGVISVVVIAAAVQWLSQRRSGIKLREEIDSLQRQVAQLSQERNENERLSNLLAQTRGLLTNHESGELLRLRGEVGLLRKQTNELLKLRAENQQLRSGRASEKPQREKTLAAGELVPVESLTFAGYATPEAAFESTFSADIKGDLKTFMNGFTPELRQEEEKGLLGKSESELAARATERAAHFAASSALILSSSLLSDDEAELVVFISAEKIATTLTMKKIAGEWKISAAKH